MAVSGGRRGRRWGRELSLDTRSLNFISHIVESTKSYVDFLFYFIATAKNA